MSIIMLKWGFLTSYGILVAKLHGYHSLGNTTSLLISVFATFIASSESKVNNKLKDPC